MGCQPSVGTKEGGEGGSRQNVTANSLLGKDYQNHVDLASDSHNKID